MHNVNVNESEGELCCIKLSTLGWLPKSCVVGAMLVPETQVKVSLGQLPIRFPGVNSMSIKGHVNGAATFGSHFTI